MNIAIKNMMTEPNLRETHCRDCALHLICLPPSVQESELPQLDAIIERGQPLPRYGTLYSQGQQFNQLFAVRAGAIKTTVILDSGIEQVTGFYLPGEIIGLESIGSKNYVNNAYAIETTSICAIPFQDLNALGRIIPSLQDHILGLMSNEIRQGHQVMVAMGKLSAQARVAMFLLSISARYKRRRLSSDHFHMPMSKSDIGNYLGLTLETVCRIFTQFQNKSMIEINGKDIRIIDRSGLCGMMEPISEPKAAS